MKLTRKNYETRNQKIVDFIIGFIGFMILNGVLGGIGQLLSALLTVPLSRLNSNSTDLIYGIVGLIAICTPLVINIGAIIFFAFTRYWIALGALTAFAVGLIIVICISIFLLATCFGLLGMYNTQSP